MTRFEVAEDAEDWKGDIHRKREEEYVCDEE